VNKQGKRASKDREGKREDVNGILKGFRGTFRAGASSVRKRMDKDRRASHYQKVQAGQDKERERL